MRALQITKQITKRESKSLERYLQEIGTIPRLTPKEEVEVAKRIEESRETLKKLPITEKAKRNRIEDKHKIKVKELECCYEKKQEELEKRYKENKKELKKELLEQKKQGKITLKKQQKARQNHIAQEHQKKVQQLQKLKEKLEKTLLSRFKKLEEQEKAQQAKKEHIKEEYEKKVQYQEEQAQKKQEELEKRYKENKKKLEKELLEQKKQGKTTLKKQQKARQNHIAQEHQKKVQQLQKLKEKLAKKLEKTLLSRFKKLEEQEKAQQAKKEHIKEEYEKKVQQLETHTLVKLKAQQKHYEKELEKKNKKHFRELEEKNLALLVKSYEKATNKHKKLKQSALKRLTKKHEKCLRNTIIEGKAKLERLEKEYNEAIHAMVTPNLRFCISVAKQYQNQGISLCDLINITNLGLIEACKRFEHSRGFKVITYAVWWLRQAIFKALPEDARPVRIPLNRSGNLNGIYKAEVKLEQKYERKPTIDEISEEIGIPANEIWNILQVSSRHVSLNTPFVEGEDNTLLDVLRDEEIEIPDKRLINDSLKKEIATFLSALSPRQKEIICLFFGIGRRSKMTLDQIGERLNLTRERVRQIKEKIIVNMRNHPNYEKLKAYL